MENIDYQALLELAFICFFSFGLFVGIAVSFLFREPKE